MSQRPTKEKAAESRLIAWYKWEFLRRNVNYQNDYRSFMAEFGSWFCKHGFWYDEASPWVSNLPAFTDCFSSRSDIFGEEFKPASHDSAFPPSQKLPPKVRRRLDIYDHCLKVWDLKALDKTFVEIGQLLFRSQVATAQRASDIYHRAEQLINGGYKELR